MLNDNNLLVGELAAHYYYSHDLIIDILNECLSDNPKEQEIINLYNELYSQRRMILVYAHAEPTFKSWKWYKTR